MNNPVGNTDSDWAGCPISCKSTSGYIFMMSGGAICWESKKQGCIALSSSEAEYIALAEAVKESIWISRLLDSVLLHKFDFPLMLHVANQGSIKIARNNTCGNRTKHIDIQYHFARESLEKDLYHISYKPGTEMTADNFTKPLTRTLFEKFRNELGLVH